MGYALCFGQCAHCRQTFAFNPIAVPSVRVNGVREPICKGCIEWANPLRKAKGLEEIVVKKGAYEACDEAELP